MQEQPRDNPFVFSDIRDIIADIRDGRMVIIVDDEDRENEGDLIMAASKVRPEDINYMARFGRGLICLTLSRSRCQQLRLPLMVNGTDEQQATNFTVSIEAAEGVTTGISAHDRARTIRVAVAPEARAEDLRQPGHVFPLMAQPGGVLTRAGHTEAGCDLARLAGLEPAAVIVEILNEDGTMARRPQLEEFARQHGLRIGSIADLIRFRLQHEVSVERIGEHPVETEMGPFRLYSYEDHVNRNVHLALVHGDISAGQVPLVRVHVQDTLGDVIGVQGPQLGWPLRSAMRRIVAAGSGVVVLLRYPETPRQLVAAVRALAQPQAAEAPRRERVAVLRTFGTGAQILRDLGVTRMRVLSAPKQMHAISGFGLEVVEYVDDPA
ncbi:MAG: 3,4-dihydroxy-2-butanone-4-phosphate synthase [Gammaproteobacteria bacterium]|nr:MAG: 3,4-dihydroxy-2-butanone-4-phosphate synthase [Pseudomonadota bacterium]MBC6944411.1 3,4-dihydroxy-2-butanone-4-phosphate synthase [Gammaproteobacteria bacterium]MCL4777730.1 3,4-dihydroxy-2-butanone-4-phosphate synthase [Gammaproteobacteria bacterium]MDL1881253.1 3,4-dihydroxy-2-butanone-4-phosphate synthase [Gammaproteobacteria bacterium PRO2]GIK33752.1 MAG: 3,4-dihydroxy-2-butanone 4-phosphate synthase [Gammaproteobacteria bacterium]